MPADDAMSPGRRGRGESRVRGFPVAILGALALVTALTAAVIYRVQRDQFVESLHEHLISIADAKASRLAAWIRQQQDNAYAIGHDLYFGEDVARWLESGAPAGAARERIEAHISELITAHTYQGVILFDSRGVRKLDFGPSTVINIEDLGQIVGAVRSGRVAFAGFREMGYEEDTETMLDFVAPLFAVKQNAITHVAGIVLSVSPTMFVEPLMQEWPVQTRTADTLLVRRGGNLVLHMTKVRNGKGTAMNLRVPLENATYPAVKAVGGAEGIIEGPDIYGTPIIAASRRVSRTDWYLLAKIDADEAYAPLTTIAITIAGTSALSYLGLSLMIALWWRSRRANELAREARLALERQALVTHYDYLAKYANDMIILFDDAFRIIEINDRVVNEFQWSREELIGAPQTKLRPPGRETSAADMERLLAASDSALYETENRRKDGSTFPVEVSLRRVEVGGKRYYQGIARDITERKRSQARIARLTRMKNALSEVNRAIVHAAEEDALFAEICAIAVRHAGFVVAWIGLVERDSGDVLPVTSAGGIVALDYVNRLKLSCRDVPEGRGPAGTAIREGRTVVANNFLDDARYALWHEAARAAGIRASTAVPLRRAGRVVAVLLVHSETADYFDAEIVSLLEEMASDVSFSLDVLAGNRERTRVQRELEFKNTVLSTQQETSPDAILLVNEAGRIISYNRQFLKVWSVPEELVRTGVDEAALQAVVGQVQNPEEFIRKIKYLYERRAEKSHDELQLKDGRIIDRHSAPVVGPAGEYFGRVWYFRDITERRRSETALTESEQRFRTIVEQSISGVYMIQDGRFTYVNSRFAEIFGYASPDEIVGKNPSELVAAKDRATVLGNIQRQLAGEVKSISYSFTGQRKDGTEVEVGVHGSLATYQGRPVIIGLLQDISERKRAEEEIKRYVTRLEQAMQSTINVVATIGELRDPYTHGHERRVGEIAAAIATEMGLDQNQVEGIRIAGYMHDVGKIAVPAEILAKPARLTKAEFDLVKDHAQQSYEILKAVPFPWPVAETAWQHHERLDGSGYPRGLKDEEIILEARVLAVADTVEAMSSHRPYRPGLGMEKALAEIEKNRGTLFCPRAVDACLRLFREKGYVIPA